MQTSHLIDRFLDAVWAERGLSGNTLLGYRQDLLKLAAALEGKGKTLPGAKREDILEFLALEVRGGRSPRSVSRYLSGYRQYYRWLVREGVLAEDPTALIESPKLGRGLPAALTEDQVEALLDAPEQDTPLGIRDRAMLELMYATGLRVSELTGLEIGNLNMNQGVVRVVGKGRKERLVPLGEQALDWLRRYLAEARPELMKGAQSSRVFVTARRAGLTRQAFWHMVRRHAAQALVRHAPAEPRGGPAGRAVAAGAQ
jgi:integrase/recombinase XerD